MSLKATAEALRIIALFICVYSFETIFLFLRLIFVGILDILCYKLRIVEAQKEAPGFEPTSPLGHPVWMPLGFLRVPQLCATVRGHAC